MPLRLAVAMASMIAMGQCLTGTALAATDWRYCLAIGEENHAIYVSQPFRSDAPLSVLEQAYDAYLTRAGLTHSSAVCPRSDSEASLLKAREEAISFNRLRGLSASQANWRFGD